MLLANQKYKRFGQFNVDKYTIIKIVYIEKKKYFHITFFYLMCNKDITG